MMKTLLLESGDVRALVVRIGIDRLMDDAIAALEAELQRFDPARFEIPMRSGFDYEAPAPGLIEWMPIMNSGARALIKVVGYHPKNPASRRLPTILSTAFAFDAGSGHLNAIVDATFATAVRTGAASAVASRILAMPEARTLGLVGCGAQAVTQLHALSRLFPIDRVLLHDIDPEAVRTLPERTSPLALASQVRFEAASPETIMSESDIVCTQTSVAVRKGPVVQAGDSHEHLHINAVGSDFPGKFELPLPLLQRSLVCPDFREQVVLEGECQRLERDAIGPSLVELVKQRAAYETYRTCPTVFDSTGWALEDQVVFGLLVDHSKALGIGREVSIEITPADPLNPYEGIVDDAAYSNGTIRQIRYGRM